MQIKSILTTTAIGTAMALTVPAFAQGGPGGPPVMEKGVNYAPFFKAVDANHDNVLTPEEWAATGIADMAYTLFESADSKKLTLAGMNNTGAFPGIDTDHDKQITLAEFQAFDKMRSQAVPKAPPPTQ